MLKVNDFFCGCGGMALGFKYAGFRLMGAWDFDRYAVESYGTNVSPKVKLQDISHMSHDEIPYADVWTFGFPCQDISIGGKKAGMIKGTTRSGMFYEIMRLLEDVRNDDPERLPSIIVAENVKLVKRYLPEIEREYNEQGYKMYYTLYNSKYWGVPQSRERYFIIGVHNRIDKPFHFIEEQHVFIPMFNTILDDNVSEKYFISEEKITPVIEQALKRVDEEERFTFTKKPGGEIDVVGSIDIKGKDDIKRVYNVEGIAPTLTTGQGGNRQPKVLLTVPVTETKADHFIFEKELTWRVRRITSREYARLQAFPESYKILFSDTQMYKQFGNAVTVTVAKTIAEQIATFLTNVHTEV